MSAQPPPVPVQRCHWYVYVIGCVPVQLPLLTVSVLSSLGVPAIVGGAVFFGACPVACTTSVGRDVASPEPELFVAVTWTRSRWPTSVVVTVYCRELAPLICWQLPASLSQRSHRNAYEVGLPVHEP